MSPEIVSILMGALCGAVIGVERQWSGRADSHFGGLRTMTLLGGLCAMAGWLWSEGSGAMAVTILAGAVAIVVVSYAASSKQSIEATTEVAGLIVISVGVLSGLGWWRLAAGASIVTAILLAEKSRLHGWIDRISEEVLHASFRFALMAAVILPLLPEGPFGPYDAFRPRQLWMLVLFFSGLSFAAYVVRGAIGPAAGYLWSGALGGLISSTTVTVTFARLSRTEEQAQAQLGLGVVGASTLTYLRVLAAAAVLNPALALMLAPVMVAPLVIGAGFVWWGWRSAEKPESLPETSNPLEFGTALKMAALFQIVMFAGTLIRDRWGAAGLWVTGAVLGLTSADALVLSMSQLGRGDQASAAAMAVGIGLLTNNALKFGLAMTMGQGRFRGLVAGGLLLLSVATAAPMVWLQMR